MSELTRRWPVQSRRIPDIGSSTRLSAAERARRIASRRAWDKIERRQDKRSNSLPSVNDMELDMTKYLDDLIEVADEKVVAAYAAAPFPGGDMLASSAEYWLRTRANMLFYHYMGHMHGVWARVAGTFNHGQLAIYYQAYMPALSEAAVDAQAGWPESTEPEAYVNTIMNAYDYDVWERAFTEVTDAPVPTMEAIKRTAEKMLDMADGLGVLDYTPMFPAMGRYARTPGTNEWLPVRGRPVYVVGRVDVM